MKIHLIAFAFPAMLLMGMSCCDSDGDGYLCTNDCDGNNPMVYPGIV